MAGELPAGIAAVAVDEEEVGLGVAVVGGGPEMEGSLVIEVESGGGEMREAEVEGRGGVDEGENGEGFDCVW